MHDNIRREAATRRIVEEAAQWMLAQREGLDEGARVAFVAWLRHSPSHVAEYMAMVAWERDMRDGASRELLDRAGLTTLAATESAVVPLHANPPRAVAAAPRRNGALPARRRWPWIASAASVLLALAGAWAVHETPRGTLYSATAETTLSLDLPDGSRIQLDRGSRIRVNLTEDARDIAVLSGTMLIDVGHASAAPLQVTTGSTTLRDIGTVFQVRMREGGSDVTVLSGSVDVMAPQPTLAARLHLPERQGDVLAHLHGGQRVTLSNEGTLATLEKQADLATDMAWLPGEIEFHDMRVTDVARRFNDYGMTPLLIEDDAIATTRISGRFHGRDPAGFVAYLQTLPGVQVHTDGDGVHVMRHAKPGKISRL